MDYMLVSKGRVVFRAGSLLPLARCWMPREGDEIRSSTGEVVARSDKGWWIFCGDEDGTDGNQSGAVII